MLYILTQKIQEINVKLLHSVMKYVDLTRFLPFAFFFFMYNNQEVFSYRHYMDFILFFYDNEDPMMRLILLAA